jgi:hypothetical protein
MSSPRLPPDYINDSATEGSGASDLLDDRIRNFSDRMETDTDTRSGRDDSLLEEPIGGSRRGAPILLHGKLQSGSPMSAHTQSSAPKIKKRSSLFMFGQKPAAPRRDENITFQEVSVDWQVSTCSIRFDHVCMSHVLLDLIMCACHTFYWI